MESDEGRLPVYEGLADLEERMLEWEAAKASQKMDQNTLDALGAEEKKEAKVREMMRLDPTISEENARRGIELIEEGKYGFIPPKKGFPTILAYGYVFRNRIMTCALSAAGLIIAGNLAISGIKDYTLKRNEQTAERRVESAYKIYSEIRDGIPLLRDAPERKTLPPDRESQLESLINTIERSMKEVGPFFERYSKGPETSVTKDNYMLVNKDAEGAEKTLAGIQNTLSSAKKIIDEERMISPLGKDLDRILGELDSFDPGFKSQGLQLYNSGKSAIEGRDIKGATRFSDELKTLLGRAQGFNDDVKRLERVYSGITAVAKDNDALLKAKGVYETAIAAKAALDTSKLRDAIDSLDTIDKILNQEYKILILGGDIRVFDEKPDVARYYLKVRAVDSKGAQVSMKIRDDEDNEEKLAYNWGEFIGTGTMRRGSPDEKSEPAVFTRVKKDKQDDNVINNNIFGVKDIGYLDLKILVTDEYGRPFARIIQHAYGGRDE